MSQSVTEEMVDAAATVIAEWSVDPDRGGPREMLRAALEAAWDDVPLSGVSMRHQWQDGQRVESVSHPEGPYGPERLRPGVVVGVDEELRRRERLKVRFDDGEERYINPDVMRHA